MVEGVGSGRRGGGRGGGRVSQSPPARRHSKTRMVSVSPPATRNCHTPSLSPSRTTHINHAALRPRRAATSQNTGKGGGKRERGGLQEERWGWLGVAGVASVVGTLCKETGATVLLFSMADDLLSLSCLSCTSLHPCHVGLQGEAVGGGERVGGRGEVKGDGRGRKGGSADMQTQRRGWVRVMGAGVLLCGVMGLRRVLTGPRFGPEFSQVDNPFYYLEGTVEWLLSIAVVHGVYARLLIWPMVCVWRVLQCVAVRCGALQCVAVCCGALQCVAQGMRGDLWGACAVCVAMCNVACNACPHHTLHTTLHTACSVQHTAPHTTYCSVFCNTLQHTATHCNTLHHTATHCTTHYIL